MSRKRRNDGLCPCTDEELLQVRSAEPDKYHRCFPDLLNHRVSDSQAYLAHLMDGGKELDLNDENDPLVWIGTTADDARVEALCDAVRQACERVRHCREKRDRAAETHVLTELFPTTTARRWRNRQPGERGAFDYIGRNVQMAAVPVASLGWPRPYVSAGDWERAFGCRPNRMGMDPDKPGRLLRPIWLSSNRAKALLDSLGYEGEEPWWLDQRSSD